MKAKTKQASGFLILYFISASFYANRILTRYIFQSSQKFGWMIIWFIALFLLLASIPVYHLIQKIQGMDFDHLYHKYPIRFKSLKIMMNLYLLMSMFLCLSFLMAITKSSWLTQTPFTLIIVPFLFIIYYVLSCKMDVLLRVATLFIYPIMIQYFLFVFSKNKALDLYAIIPFKGQGPTNLWICIFACINMILDLGLCLFYMQECSQKIKKGPYALVIFTHLFSLCFDSLIATGQFGVLISDFPFAYYESWRIINFGQYIAYLDIFAFFYWVTSAFCRIAISFWLIKAYEKPRKWFYQASYIILWFSVVYSLNHATFYAAIREPMLVISTVLLSLSLMIHIYTIRKEITS